MRRLALFAVLVFSFGSPAVAGWEEDLDRALAMDAGGLRDALVTTVLDAEPGWRAIAERIVARRRPEASTGSFLRKRVCADEVERPWVLIVPEGYDPARPTPLLIALHGGVSREQVLEDPLAYAEQSPYARLARERVWLVAFPMGQKGATWWDDVGMANIRDIVRTVKRERNVDDDRVWMAGFSDGASAAFLHAMVSPTDYGAFLALNGHMGVGSHVGELETFAPNFANSPVYVMTSFADPLYPSEKMRPSIEMAIRAGARFLYREFPGGHDFGHVEPEMENLGDFLARHPRDPFPGRVVWETADTERFGACRWLAIDEISNAPAAPWHEDFNALVAEDRVSIGFYHDVFEGEGVKVKSVVEESFAATVRLAPGDVVTRMNGAPIRSLDDLNAAKAHVHRGDRVVLVVRRDGKEVALSGNLPPAEHEWILRREKRSALARAVSAGNRVDVEGSRVGALRILVHPAMVNVDEPLVVAVNGEERFDDVVEPDAGFLLRNYLANRDRKLLYVAEVRVDVPNR